MALSSIEALSMSFQRANFADAMPYHKPSFYRKLRHCQPPQSSPTKTYSSFDSLSVVLDHIPRELPEAGVIGIGAKGDFERLDHNLEAPANILANLIPVSAYIVKPSTEIIHAFLTRAYDVPLFIMSVAACILDALSSKAFAKAWRDACPLPITFQPDRRGPFGSCSSDGRTLHLRNLPLDDRRVSPEIIVLAALALADAFTPDDRDHTDKYWILHVAYGRYTAAQLNATKRCILHDLDHALLPFTGDYITRAMVREMAKWQYKAREIEVEKIMRDVGTWRSPSPRASRAGAPRLSNYQHPTVFSAASSSYTSTSTPSTSLLFTSLPSTSLPSTSLPSTSLPTTSLPSTSLPSTSLPSTSSASTSAAVAPLTQANLQRHAENLRWEAFQQDWAGAGDELVIVWR